MGDSAIKTFDTYKALIKVTDKMTADKVEKMSRADAEKALEDKIEPRKWLRVHSMLCQHEDEKCEKVLMAKIQEAFPLKILSRTGLHSKRCIIVWVDGLPIGFSGDD